MNEETLSLFGLPYFCGGMAQAIAHARDALEEGRAFSVFTPGATVAARAVRDADLATLLSSADLLLPDGKGVSLAARICGAGRLPAVAGIDFTERLLALANEGGARVFFYGAAQGVAARAAERMQRTYPSLCIKTAEGYGDDPWQAVAEFAPSIVCVGLGAGRQEAWIAKNKAHVGGVLIGVGGSFDVWAGEKRRAPRFFRRAGLEWAWRTLLEPRRLPRLFPLPRYYLKCVRFRQIAKKRERKQRRV